MTGDEAYHADCFRCTLCDTKIDDLVFAKTSQGIYCMRCHQERKEAKRQREREERERMDHSQDKSLPTVPGTETTQAGSHSPGGHNSPQTGYTPRLDSRPKTNGSGLPSLDVGPPFLPPLAFGLDDPASGGFDLGDMLSGSEKDSSPPTPSSKEAEIIDGHDRNSVRRSIARAHARLSTSTLNNSEGSAFQDGLKPLFEISESPTVASGKRISDRFLNPTSSSSSVDSSLENLSPSEAAALIRELRGELAKYNPMSPLVHGTPQQEYGLLFEKTEKLAQSHAQLEKAVRDLYIEKDLLGMDLEAINEELKAKEEALTSNNTDRLQPITTPTPNPRLSTGHDLMKQAYQVEVKALQEQKERLQRELQAYMDQRDGILDEMQILSVRNAELSTINNDMMREMHERKDTKPQPAAAAPSAGGGMLQSFSGKMRKQRQPSGGNQQELKAPQLAVARSSDSTYSFNSTISDDPSRFGSTNKQEDIQEDIFGEEIIAPKKFNWKKGTINTLYTGVSTVKSVGAMFGKLIVEGPNYGPEATPSSRGSNDAGSGHGQILPPRSYSINSDTGSLHGRFSENHSFVQYNYAKTVRCDSCEDKLWGREYRCSGCGIQIHNRCIPEFHAACSGKLLDSDASNLRVSSSGGSSHGVPPPPPPKQIMFGNDLLDQLALEQRTIPLVVEKCIEAVDERGLDVEGIYRRSGMAAEARQMVQAYDAGLQPDLMDTSIYQDICSITSVLKQYLRNLPDPLIPYNLYQDFLEATGVQEPERRLKAFKTALSAMPIAHYDTLRILMEHLNRVTDRESINLMTSKNLSVVFGPTLMRNPDPSREIMDMAYKNMTIEYLIVNTIDIFQEIERPSTSSANSDAESAQGHGTERNAKVGAADTTATSGTALPGSVTIAAAAGGLPNGYKGQRQGSVGSLNQNQMHAAPPIPLSRRAPGHIPSQDSPSLQPTLLPRTNSGEAIPTMNQVQSHQQQQQYQQQQQQQQQQMHNQHAYQQQQMQQQQQHPNKHSNQQQQFYRPQQFQPPQHQTLQQLKQQQQQREQQQREQQQREQQQQQQQQREQQQQQQQQQQRDDEQDQRTSSPLSPVNFAHPQSPGSTTPVQDQTA
ncbi:hypothetical protein BGZ99_006907 [Dissophora globulifera]|uniref:RhoGAP-domain-containing protein n=1 Tax=Dissophora globulifera TaxID=979702 RepID=A0A9P6RBE5_9FUNG|nr:hypothetical protein BGZ99_006907 [Dissophora globulifera]